MRCDECRYWVKGDRQDWESSAVGFGWCSAVRERWKITDGIRWGGGDEAWEGYVTAKNAALTAARAYVQDGSEYRAELITGPDFFCALWAAQ